VLVDDTGIEPLNFGFLLHVQLPGKMLLTCGDAEL